MSIRFNEEEFIRLKDILLVYEWGRQTLMTKMDIIQADFKHFHSNNPIEHIKSRIKSPESIAAKLNKLAVPLTAQAACEHIRDIAGIRIICQFARDIYQLAGILRTLPGITVLKEKDYVTTPKPSGYRSYHLIVAVPVDYSGKTDQIPVEIQIRTEAMDFWATLEHKVRYKYDEHIPPYLCKELEICAGKIAELDDRMFLIHDIISLINQNEQNEIINKPEIKVPPAN